MSLRGFACCSFAQLNRIADQGAGIELFVIRRAASPSKECPLLRKSRLKPLYRVVIQNAATFTAAHVVFNEARRRNIVERDTDFAAICEKIATREIAECDREFVGPDVSNIFPQG